MKYLRISFLLPLLLAICLSIQADEYQDEEERSMGLRPRTINSNKSANLQAALDSVTDIRVSRSIIAFYTITTIAAKFGYLATHFMFWDPQDTKNSERFSPIRVYNSFTNPDIALSRIIGVVGQCVFQVLVLAIPTLLWTGKPLDDNIPNDPEDRHFALSGGAKTGEDYAKTFRNLLSPNSVAINLTLAFLCYLGDIVFWFVAPFFARDKKGQERKLNDGNFNPIMEYIEEPPMPHFEPWQKNFIH